MAARIGSILFWVMSLCVMVSVAMYMDGTKMKKEDIIEHNYNQIFSNRGLEMDVNETWELINSVDEYYWNLWNRHSNAQIPFEDLHRKLRPLIDSKTEHRQKQDVRPCFRVLRDWESSPLRSYMNLKPLVDIEIEKNISICRVQLESFVRRLVPFMRHSEVWDLFKSSVRNQLESLNRSESSSNNTDILYQRAFDEILNNQDDPESANELNRGFQEYHGASRQPVDKIKDEMFHKFSPNDCDHVKYMEELFARSPQKYIGDNPEERDVVDRLLAYCALKDYSGQSEASASPSTSLWLE